MGTQIQKDLTLFAKGLENADKILSSFSLEFSEKLNSIGQELNNLSVLTLNLRCNDNSPAATLINSEIDIWSSRLKQCSEYTKNNIVGREFQSKFEKSPLVIVFGVVKAGKSTLGNFLHGRSFRKAEFDNEYKNGQIPISKIYVEESGRDDAKIKDAFDENSVESTCSAQYFQFPGLAWVDTPGTGAIVKGTDKRSLEDIAKQYVQYADLVIFLANSANPGIAEDIQGYANLYADGKKALIIITRSDTIKTTVENGKIVKKRIPKDSRKLQETSLLETMSKEGIPRNQLDAVSISTLLAEEAVEKQDDSLWLESNMGLLYKKIINVISNNEILELKKSAPKKLLNLTIKSIIGDTNNNNKDNQNSLNGLITSMSKILNQIDNKFDSLSPKGQLITDIVEDVINSVRGLIRGYIDDVCNNKHENTRISLSAINSKIQPTLENVLHSHIRKIIGDYKQFSIDTINTDNIEATAQHNTEKHKYTTKVAYRERRDASGVFETIASWFGKKYYGGVRYEDVQREEIIDLGMNTKEARQSLVEQLENRVSEFVKTQLDNLRTQFFGESKKKMTELISKLHNMKSNLEQLRYQE